MGSSLPVWSSSTAAVAWLSAAVLVAACGEPAAVVTVESDLSAPDEISDFCLLVEDRDPGGGAYAESFRLSESLSLPQTLTVFPGSATAGIARARGFSDGDEIARDHATVTFDSGVSDTVLALDGCQPREAKPPATAHTAAAPAGAQVIVSYGRGGAVILAAGDGEATAFVAADGQLSPVSSPLPAAPDKVAALAILDADGDCDDDVVMAGAAGLEIWLRGDGPAFAAGGIDDDGSPLAAVAAADVDEDGDVDVVAGGGPRLVLFRNDGSGGFGLDAAAIDSGAMTLDITALAIADVSGDGHPDLVIGQGAENPAPVIELANDASGTGFFELSAGALPPTGYVTRDVAAIDANNDGAVGIVVATAGGVRHFFNRGDGRLEDRSFVTLPEVAWTGATSVAVADFDDNCIADVAVGQGEGAPVFLRGTVTGQLELAAISADAGGDAVIADVDDDGAGDVVLTGGQPGILWLSR